jgi:hypothetical protein
MGTADNDRKLNRDNASLVGQFVLLYLSFSTVIRIVCLFAGSRFVNAAIVRRQEWGRDLENAVT